MEIICGDFRDFEIPPEAFVISDPPYNQRYHYATYEDGLADDEYASLLHDAFVGRKSVVIHYPEETIGLLGPLFQDFPEQVVSWVYPSNTAKQSRLITWWNCKPDFRKIGQPYKNPTDKRIAKRILEGKTARAYDWWEINQVKNVSKKENAHPCPIPLELARRIVLSTTQKGDLVVDPFAGSGTIGVACKELGREFVGYEIDPMYCEIARQRLGNQNKE